MTVFIRAIAITAALAATGFYLLMLLLLTYGGCYGQSASCPQGWLWRTIATGVYLAAVAVIVLVTRWVLRTVARSAADRRTADVMSAS